MGENQELWIDEGNTTMVGANSEAGNKEDRKRTSSGDASGTTRKARPTDDATKILQQQVAGRK